jgi:hypothetical protein
MDIRQLVRCKLSHMTILENIVAIIPMAAILDEVQEFIE